jgi:SH3 domain-containing YSC84-like protein 1
MPGRIPAYVLDNAKGIAVIRGELRAGFIFGAELGAGVLVSRLPDGSWSPPALISLAGASFGLQIGGEARDIVLIFNTITSMDYIESGLEHSFVEHLSNYKSRYLSCSLHT